MNDDRALGGDASPVISIVVTVNNESGNIEPLLAEIAEAAVGRWAFEAIYVDDGSTDDTLTELRQEAARYPWLRVVRHDHCCGKSEALRTGVLAARAPLIVMLDGDCQDDPSFMSKLMEAYEANPMRIGLVAGQRKGRKDTRFKRIQSRIANAVRRSLLKDETRDTGCGLKIAPRDVFLRLPYFDGQHRFLPALVRREGYDIALVDVVNRPRLAGTSKYGMWNRLWIGILDLFGVWWLIRRRKRLPEVSEVKVNAD